MSETDAQLIPATPEPALPPAAPRRHVLAWLVAIVLVILSAAAYFAARSWLSARQQAAEDGQQQLATRVEAVARGAEQARRDAESLRSRLDDETKVNQSLREQLLALGERARLVEDALANLADKRLSGHDALLLNEAEMLLALAAERYTLFHDSAAAIDAYHLADTALTAVDDAAFSTVRQSITAEAEAFGRLQGADTATTLAALAALRTDSAKLPGAPHELDTPGDGTESRWSRWFGQFVRVRHGADAAALSQRHETGLARQLFTLDLRDAEAALLARDETRYRAAIADAQALLGSDFDPAAEAVKSARASLANLANAALAPPAPAILGSALKELRNLRATHALRQTPRAPVPAPDAASP
jgi:uroporphyrin-3 C-methyltransferase